MTAPPSSFTDERAARQAARLLAAGFEALARRRFRGEVHEEDLANEHLAEFLQCHFYRKILRDALLPSTRRQGLRKANQIGGTRIGELIMKYLMKHRPGNMIIYDETIEKSRDHMRNRFMPMIKEVPELAAALREIVEQGGAMARFDVTTQDILFPGMVFRARPLNESWTQSITVIYGMISDAALCEPEQIRRAFVRSRQHEGEDFWFIESQGDAPMGKKGGGFADFMATTNEMKLHVRCPECGSRQRFVFHHQRNEETVIVLPRARIEAIKTSNIQHSTSSIEADLEVALLELEKTLRAEDRKHAGFKVAGELKLDDGSLDEQLVMRNTVYECVHCGEHWRDDNERVGEKVVAYGETRKYLDREAGLDENWTATNPKALPGYLGYSLPVWINPKISWGSAMLNFRRAMAAFSEGDPMPLQEFRTKWEGEDWDEKTSGRVKFTPAFNSVDPSVAIPNEAGRGMSVDCQKDKKISAQNPDNKGGMTGHFWVVAHAWDNKGNQQQLWRGYCTSWQEWIAKARELQISAYDIVIDGKFWLDDVINHAAANAELMEEYSDTGRKTGRRAYVSWTVLTGDSYRSWKHEDGNYRDFSMPKNEVVPVDFNGQTNPVEVKIIRWSNHRFKDQLLTILQNTALKMPGKTTLMALPPNAADPKNPQKFLLSDQTREMEVDTNQHQRTWESQMSANVRTTNPKSRLMEIVETHSDPHYFDCCCGILYLMKRQGLLGAVAPEEMTAPEAT